MKPIVNASSIVSVIIPSYNRARFLGRAIQSILDQTYRNFEILVIDDGSTDGTRDVAESFGKVVRYVYQPNSGVSAARNHGIRIARGDYLAFLDSDDEFLPTKLEKQIAYLETHSRVGMVYSSYLILDEVTHQSYPSRQPLLSGWVFRELLLRCMWAPLTTPTVMLRKVVLECVGLFDETMHLAEDIDLWCRVARRFEIASLPEPLSRIHRHAGNISGNTDPERNLAVWLYIVEKIFQENDQLDPIYKRRLYARIYRETWSSMLYRGKYRQAAEHLLRGLSYWPSLDPLRFPLYYLRVYRMGSPKEHKPKHKEIRNPDH